MLPSLSPGTKEGRKEPFGLQSATSPGRGRRVKKAEVRSYTTTNVKQVLIRNEHDIIESLSQWQRSAVGLINY